MPKGNGTVDSINGNGHGKIQPHDVDTVDGPITFVDARVTTETNSSIQKGQKVTFTWFGTDDSGTIATDLQAN